MTGLRWRAIAGLTGAVFAVLTGAIAFTVARSHLDSMPKPAPDPHALPLDFADPELRDALEAHAKFDLEHGLDAIADGCRERERYRVAVNPGLFESGFTSVELDVAGGTAVATAWRFRTGSEGGGSRWRVSSQVVLGEREIDAVRAAAARLLFSRMPPAIEDGEGDSSEWIAETCRSGRYHFWRRRNPSASQADQAPFVAFVRTLLAFDKPVKRHSAPMD